MRIAVAMAVAGLSITAVSAADSARAAIRKHTEIAAQPLESALAALAKDRDFQVLYRSDLVANLDTRAVAGEFTFEEVLRRLLTGSGLEFKYLDDQTITIIPGSARSPAPAAGSAPEQRAGLSGSGKSAWLDRWRLPSGTKEAGTRDIHMELTRLAQADGAAEPAPASEVAEVVVIGRRFLDEDTSGTTNLPLPIEEVPQSISLISADFLSAADVRTLGEVAQYTPGAINAGNSLGFGTLVKLRGFLSGAALDGLTVASNGYGSGYEPDYANIERLEVVKGPSSVVYGAASPGGLINMVTKSARHDTPSYVLARGGMWNDFRLEGQLAGSLDSEGRVNAIGVAVREKADSFIDVINHDKTALYGGLDGRLSESVMAYLHGGYESFTRTGFDGIPPLPDGTPAPVRRSFFIGSDQFNYVTRVTYASAGADWNASDLWQVSVKGNYSNQKSHGIGAYAFDLQENGDFSFTTENQAQAGNKYYTLGASSVYKLDRLGVDDSFIAVSALYRRNKGLYQYVVPSYGGDWFSTANIHDDPDDIYAAIEAVDFDSPDTLNTSDTKLASYSTQAVVQIVEPLTLLLGASYSEATRNQNGANGREKFDFGSEISYRAGITYEIARGLNAYASYSESFQPQSLVDINDQPLPPLRGKQSEIGVKYAPPGSRLLLTGAVFELLQSNSPAFDQVLNGDRYKAVGEVRHRGMELEAVGQLSSRWELRAGYAYLDPVITRTEDPALVGTTISYLPKNAASMFSSYSLTNSLSVGAGVRYVDSVRTGTDGSTRNLPSYIIIDAMAQYVLGSWDFQLNLHNLLDEKYYINTYETVFYGNIPGTPTNVSLSARYTF